MIQLFYRTIVLICLIFISSGGYTFPEINHYNFTGGKTYNRSNNMLGYVRTRYNGNGQMVYEGFFNNEKQLIKYKVYQYNNLGLLVQEIQFNHEKKWTKKIEIENRNGRPYLKTISLPDKKFQLFIEYSYGFYQNQPLYEVEKFYYKGKYGARRDYFVKKKVFTKKSDNELVIEFFKKPADSPDSEYQFEKLEVRRFNSRGRIDLIVRLNSAKQPLKYLKYLYDDSGKISQVRIYQIKPGYSLASSETKRGTQRFYLKTSVHYFYTEEAFPAEVNQFQPNTNITIATSESESNPMVTPESKSNEKEEQEALAKIKEKNEALKKENEQLAKEKALLAKEKEALAREKKSLEEKAKRLEEEKRRLEKEKKESLDEFKPEDEFGDDTFKEDQAIEKELNEKGTPEVGDEFRLSEEELK